MKYWHNWAVGTPRYASLSYGYRPLQTFASFELSWFKQVVCKPHMYMLLLIIHQVVNMFDTLSAKIFKIGW